MASLRSIKKDIDYLVNEVITDCYLSLYFHPDRREQVIALMQEAVGSRNELIEMANNPADKHNPTLVRKHYAFLRRTMFEKMDGFFSRLSELNK